MSDVTGQQVKSPRIGPAERAYFLKDERAAENIEVLREHLTSYISEKIPGTSPERYGPRLPRYGVHGMLAMKTRFFAYDHPAFLQKCDTAFTNGDQVWFSADFLNALVDEFKDNPKTASAFLIGLHELTHILDNHFSRSEGLFLKYKGKYPDAPDDSIYSIFNIGMDIAINQRLVKAFTSMPPGKIFVNTVWGLADEHQKYQGWSEEAIIEDLFKVAEQQDEMRAEQQQKAQDEKQDEDKDKDEKDAGDPSDETDPDGQPSDDAEGEPEKPGENGEPSDDGEAAPGGDEPSDEPGEGGSPGESDGKQPGDADGKNPGGSGKGDEGVDGDGPGEGTQPGKGKDPSKQDPNGQSDAGGDGQGETDPNQDVDNSQAGQQPGGQSGAPAAGGVPQDGVGAGFGELPSLQSQSGNDFKDMMTPEEFIKTALENGLEESLRKLGMLPDDMDADDVLNEDGSLSDEAIEHLVNMEKDRDRVVENTINEALGEMRKNGGKFPGQHMLEMAAVRIREKSKPKLTWLMEAENLINGGMGESSNSYDNLHDITMFDPEDMNMLSSPILEGVTPAEPDIVVACLIDTSGSMTDDILRTKITEAGSLVRKYRAKLVLFSADTTVRSEPIVLTPENIDEIMSDMGIALFGRGGTDIEGSMAMLDNYDCIELVNQHSMVPSARTEKHPDAILYLTDMMDGIPRKANLPESVHKTIFICPEDTPRQLLDEYNKEGFSVYRVLEENVVSLSKRAKVAMG